MFIVGFLAVMILVRALWVVSLLYWDTDYLDCVFS